MDKKGLSHVEMVLSFVIFTGFVLFLFSIFQPFEIRQEKDIYLKSLEREMMERLSSEVIFQSLVLNKSAKCFKINYSDIPENYKVTVKDKNDNIVEGKMGGDYLKIGNQPRSFFYILSGELFKSRDINCNGSLDNISKCNQSSNSVSNCYTLGWGRTYDVVYNQSLYKMKRNYENNYSQLKKDLGLPESKNFAFLVSDVNKTVLKATKKKPKVEVYARTKLIQIAYKSGKIKYYTLNIQTW